MRPLYHSWIILLTEVQRICYAGYTDTVVTFTFAARSLSLCHLVRVTLDCYMTFNEPLCFETLTTLLRESALQNCMLLFFTEIKSSAIYFCRIYLDNYITVNKSLRYDILVTL